MDARLRFNLLIAWQSVLFTLVFSLLLLVLVLVLVVFGLAAQAHFALTVTLLFLHFARD